MGILAAISSLMDVARARSCRMLLTKTDSVPAPHSSVSRTRASIVRDMIHPMMTRR